MKLWHADLLTHYQQSTTRLVPIWRVRRLDGQAYGFIDATRAVTIDGIEYRPGAGLQVSAVEHTATFAVATLDVTSFLDVSTEEEIQAGIWEEAAVDIAEVRWDAPPATWDPTRLNVLRSGYLGRVQRQNLRFTAEIRSLSSRLDTRLGRQVEILCPWFHALWTGATFEPQPECSADLTGKIHTGTVTALGADPHMEFSVNLAQETGYFDAGVVAMTSGANAGLGRLSSMDVKRWENGVLFLRRPLPYAVQIGNTCTAVQGDDKTFATCRAVYANAPNFGGFPYVPGEDAVLSSPLVGMILPPRPAPPDGNPDLDGNVTGPEESF